MNKQGEDRTQQGVGRGLEEGGGDDDQDLPQAGLKEEKQSNEVRACIFQWGEVRWGGGGKHAVGQR